MGFDAATNTFYGVVRPNGAGQDAKLFRIDILAVADGNILPEDDDHIRRGEGNDYLNGSSDHDEVHGGAGDDTLDGGSGFDLLYGGDGIDILNGCNDRITDFRNLDGNNDRLDFKSLNLLSSGMMADDWITQFVVMNADSSVSIDFGECIIDFDRRENDTSDALYQEVCDGILLR